MEINFKEKGGGGGIKELEGRYDCPVSSRLFNKNAIVLIFWMQLTPMVHEFC